jgi:acetate kinase
LGSGASLCALRDRKSIDSTMGFTALDGLCMGTRPGILDPGVVLYLFQNLGLSVKQVEEILYKKSGLLGISGISNDMRDLLSRTEPDAQLAIDYFVYRAASPEIRRRISAASAWLGIELDFEANAAGGPQISKPRSQVSCWVIPTNEELMIARHTSALLGLQ